MTTLVQTFARSVSRNVLLLLAAELLIGFTLDGGIYAVLFNLYLLRLDYGPEFVGIINSAGLLAFALCSFPAGLLGKRWGIKRMMLLGLGIMIAGCLLLPSASLVATPAREAALIGGYVLVMSGLSFFFVNSTPFLMGSTQAVERNRIFALQMAVLSVAAFAGSLFGGRLPGLLAPWLGTTVASPEPYRDPLLLCAFLLLPALWLVASAEEVDPQAAERRMPGQTASQVSVSAAPLMLLIMLVVVRFFQTSGVATTSTFFNVYLDTSLRVSTEQIGLLTALGRLLAVPVALLVPLLAGRWGNRNLVVLAGLGAAISFLPLALVPHWAAAGVGFVGVVGLSALRYPAFMVYAMERVAPAQRGAVAGAGEMAGGLTFGLVALGGGYLVAGFGFRPLFLLAFATNLIGALLFWLYFRSNHAANEREVG